MGRVRLALLILLAVAGVAAAAFFIDGARTDQYEASATFGIVEGLPDTDRVRLAGELAPEINSALFLNSLNEQIGDGDVRELRASPSENGEIRVKIRAGSSDGIEAGIAGAFAQLDRDQRENRQRQVANDLGDIERRLIVIDQSLAAGQGDTDLLTEERESLAGEQELLTATIDVSPVELVEPAEIPDSPVSPRPIRTAAWAAFAAAVLGAMAFLRFGRATKPLLETPKPVDVSDLVTPPAALPTVRPGLLSSRLAGDAATSPPRSDATQDTDHRFGRTAPLAAVRSVSNEVAATVTKDDDLANATPLLAVAPLLARDPQLATLPPPTVDRDHADPVDGEVEAEQGAAQTRAQLDDADDPSIPRTDGEEQHDDLADLANPTETTADAQTPGPATVSPLTGGIDDVARRLETAGFQAGMVVRADGTAAHDTGQDLIASLANQGQTAAHLRVTTAASQAERLVFQRWSDDEANASDRPVTGDKGRPYTQLAIENPAAQDLDATVAKLRRSNDHVLITADALDVDGLASIGEVADALVVDAGRWQSPAEMANRFPELPHVATVQADNQSGGVPWWLIAAGAAVLLVGGVGAAVALSGGDDPADQASTATSVDQDAATDDPPTTDAPTTAPVSTAPVAAAPTTAAPATAAPTTAAPTTAAPATTAPATPAFTLVLPDNLPGVEQPARQGIYRDGKLYLEGEVESRDVADQIIERAVAVIGAENVIDNYVIDPAAPRSTAGTVLVDEAILFSSGSAFLDPTDNELLGLGEAILRLYPNVTMRIVGHTDNVGSAASNLALSENRAQAMADYYISLGIPADRFEVEGRGESQPVGPNLTEEGRAQNRRIVVELLDLLS